jgi:hypothetical protein
MNQSFVSKRLFCVLAGLSCIVGVVLLILSFSLNPGPPPDATSGQLVRFGHQYYASVLWGAWLQAVGPALYIYSMYRQAIRRVHEHTFSPHHVECRNSRNSTHIGNRRHQKSYATQHAGANLAGSHGVGTSDPKLYDVVALETR